MARTRAGAIEVGGHLERHGPDIIAVFFQVPPRDLEQFRYGNADRVVEPGLNAEMKEGDGEASHHDRWDDSDAAEQQHETHVKARAR